MRSSHRWPLVIRSGKGPFLPAVLSAGNHGLHGSGDRPRHGGLDTGFDAARLSQYARPLTLKRDSRRIPASIRGDVLVGSGRSHPASPPTVSPPPTCA